MPDTKQTESWEGGGAVLKTGLTDALALRLHRTIYGALEGVGQMLLPSMTLDFLPSQGEHPAPSPQDNKCPWQFVNQTFWF